jgi:hypothetical protein
MPFDPNGNFSRLYSWADDRDNGIRILADRHDGEDDNFADGFNAAFLRTGIVAMTGDIKMGSNGLHSIRAGTAAVPSVTFELSGSTGIYQVGALALGFTSNGVEKFEVNSAGASVFGNLAATTLTVASGGLTLAGDISAVNGNFSGNIVAAAVTCSSLSSTGDIWCQDLSVVNNLSAANANFGGVSASSIYGTAITSPTSHIGNADGSSLIISGQINTSTFHADNNISVNGSSSFQAITSSTIACTALSCSGVGTFTAPAVSNGMAFQLVAASGGVSAYMQFVNAGAQAAWLGLDGNNNFGLWCKTSFTCYVPTAFNSTVTVAGQVGVAMGLGARNLSVNGGIRLYNDHTIDCENASGQLVLCGGTGIANGATVICQGNAISGGRPNAIDFYTGGAFTSTLSAAQTFGLGTATPDIGGQRVIAVDHNAASVLDLRLNGTSNARITGKSSAAYYESPGAQNFYCGGNLSFQVQGAGAFAQYMDPIAGNNSGSVGQVTRAWNQVWTYGTSSPSDERMKEWQGDPETKYLNAAYDITDELGFYRWQGDADDGKRHFGVRAQWVAAALMDAGIERRQELDFDPSAFVAEKDRPTFESTFVSFHSWDGQEPGTETSGNRFAVAYDQIALLLIKGLAERIKTLEEKVADLSDA